MNDLIVKVLGVNSKKISLIIVIVLFFMSMAFSSLLYSLKPGSSFPDIPTVVKFIGEFFFYVIVLVFINGTKIDPVKWLQEGAAFIFFRIILSFCNGIIFYLLFSPRGGEYFIETYIDALWKFTPTYLFQVLIAPALTYPLFIFYFTDTEKEKEHLPIVTKGSSVKPEPVTKVETAEETGLSLEQPAMDNFIELERTDISEEEILAPISNEKIEEIERQEESEGDLSAPVFEGELIPIENSNNEEDINKPENAVPGGGHGRQLDLAELTVHNKEGGKQRIIGEKTITNDDMIIVGDDTEDTVKSPNFGEEKDEDEFDEFKGTSLLSDEDIEEIMASAEEDEISAPKQPQYLNETLQPESTEEIKETGFNNINPSKSEEINQNEKPREEREVVPFSLDVTPIDEEEFNKSESPVKFSFTEDEDIEKPPPPEISKEVPSEVESEEESKIDDLIFGDEKNIEEQEVPAAEVTSNSEKDTGEDIVQHDFNISPAEEGGDVIVDIGLVDNAASNIAEDIIITGQADMKEGKSNWGGNAEEEQQIVRDENDYMSFNIKEILEDNKDRQSSGILKSLIRRSYGFDVQIPVRKLLNQLKSGEVKLSVGFIYDLIPIELVNFQSTDKGSDLTQTYIYIPFDKVIARVAPEILNKYEIGEKIEKHEPEFSSIEKQPEEVAVQSASLVELELGDEKEKALKRFKKFNDLELKSVYYKGIKILLFIPQESDLELITNTIGALTTYKNLPGWVSSESTLSAQFKDGLLSLVLKQYDDTYIAVASLIMQGGKIAVVESLMKKGLADIKDQVIEYEIEKPEEATFIDVPEVSLKTGDTDLSELHNVLKKFGDLNSAHFLLESGESWYTFCTDDTKPQIIACGFNNIMKEMKTLTSNIELGALEWITLEDEQHLALYQPIEGMNASAVVGIKSNLKVGQVMWYFKKLVSSIEKMNK
ncbi:MAG: hypothetical protein JW737_09400 [Acidobacteria bacterium]|nr:hypothetical protein [Acidobacteriota bacterium]